MIITLSGADFSSKNIGTLNSWRIVRSLTGVSTTSSVSSVAKGASYSANFSIQSGYEYLENGANITMGGTDITSTALTWNSEKTVATVSIASVTGNVNITITAKLAEVVVTPLATPSISIVEV